MTKKIFLLFLSLVPAWLHAEFKVKMYGYAKLDVEYCDKNVGSIPSPPPEFTPLSTDKSAQHGELLIDARESRVGVEASGDVNDIHMIGGVEVDFFTLQGLALTDNGRLVRLRLAYGHADLSPKFFFMAGQYWSLYMNVSLGQPYLVDFNGPAGAPVARQPQLRVGYVKDLCEGWGSLLFEADIEKHSSSEEGYTVPDVFRSTAQGSEQKLPLFVGKITWTNKPLAMELAGCGTQTTVTKNSHGSQLKIGVWGAQFTIEWKPWPSLTLYGTARYLVGLSRLANGDFIDATINDFNRLCPVYTPAWYAGFHWLFAEKTSLNGVFGWEKASRIPHSTFSGSTKGFFQSIHFNILHEFWEHWKTGIEYQRFDTKTFNGIHGHVNMLHFGLWYFF